METFDSSNETKQHILTVRKYLEITNKILKDRKDISISDINFDINEVTLIDLLNSLYLGKQIPCYDKLFQSIGMNSKIYLKTSEETDINLLTRYIDEINDRKMEHDKTKLQNPEKREFDKLGSKLKYTTYGSEQYKENLIRLKRALYHHYRCNRHHPEHFGNSIYGMTIMDLIEMLCDWRASSFRQIDGDIFRSIIIGKDRFNYSENMEKVLTNTVKKHYNE